ncbi:MAG: EscU/YscU/HrcU family type III secretion system export apparatus switch protein [Betaproteobacteria bacterium]|nr:EscU/YscU/HrcU family type III secretion system export apparatus switch protein [Rhodocyclales bacterium]
MATKSKEGEQQALAVALKYAPGTSAPTVVAKGRGLIAQEIISRARENGVFVHESPELVALLSHVDLDGQIPPQLYVAVAELLAWIYQVEREGKLPDGLIVSKLG